MWPRFTPTVLGPKIFCRKWIWEQPCEGTFIWNFIITYVVLKQYSYSSSHNKYERRNKMKAVKRVEKSTRNKSNCIISFSIVSSRRWIVSSNSEFDSLSLFSFRFSIRIILRLFWRVVHFNLYDRLLVKVRETSDAFLVKVLFRHDNKPSRL